MYCPHCGTQLTAEARFCSVCGTARAGANAFEGRVTVSPAATAAPTAVAEATQSLFVRPIFASCAYTLFLLAALLPHVSVGVYSSDVYVIAISPSNEDHILLWQNTRGFAQSTDAGDSFVPTGSNLKYVRSLLILKNGITLAGSLDGLFFSPDGGKTWAKQNELPEGVKIYSLVNLPGTGTVLGLTSMGLLRSADPKSTWTFAGLQNQDIFGFPFAFSGKTVVISNGVWLTKSSDGGVTWANVPVKDNLKIYSLSIVEGTVGSPERIFMTTPKGLFSSVDGGKKWKEINEDVRNFVLLSGNATAALMFAAAAPTQEPYSNYFSGGSRELPGGLFRSSDLGKHWSTDLRPEPDSNHWPSFYAENTDLVFFETGRTAKHIFVEILNGPVYRSDNAGGSWKNLSNSIAATKFPKPAPMLAETPVGVAAPRPTPETRSILMIVGQVMNTGAMHQDTPIVAVRGTVSPMGSGLVPGVHIDPACLIIKNPKQMEGGPIVDGGYYSGYGFYEFDNTAANGTRCSVYATVR